MTSTAVTPTSAGNGSTPCFKPKEYNIPRVVDLYINVAVGIILIVSIIGNILVVRGICKIPTRPVSYLLIGNIAVAELIEASNYFFGLHFSTRPWDWIFGETICRLTFSTGVCCITVISFTLAALSVHRCCILTRPRIHVTKARFNVYVVVVFSWLWGVSIATPYTVVGWVIKHPLCKGGVTRSCTFDTPHDKSMSTYIGSIPFIAHYLGPLLVIVISYGVVVFVLKKHIQRTRNEELEMTENVTELTIETNGHDDPPSAETDRRHSCKIVQMELRLLRIIFATILIYLICYSPENFVYLAMWFNWFHIDDDKKMSFRKHTNLLHALSMALHPICYGWMSGIIQRNFFKCAEKNQKPILILNVLK